MFVLPVKLGRELCIEPAFAPKLEVVQMLVSELNPEQRYGLSVL